MKNNFNYKINIDKERIKYYNKTEIEIFTYEEYMSCKRYIGNVTNELREESVYYQIINNEHDKVFRKILDNKQEAANLINQTFNLKINFEKLEKYNSSFITNDLKNKESDVIYKLKDKKIFFLIEHQTKIDYSMPYRILEYENEIMKSAIDYKKLNKKSYKLPLIITIVLYTGNKKWDAQKYVKDVQEKLEGYDEILFSKYNVVDVNNFNNDDLLEEKSLLSKMMLIEKAKNKEQLIMYLDRIIKKITENRNIYNDEIVDIFITIINLLLKKKIGQEKAEKLIKILKGGNDKMLAVLDMIEKDDKRIFIEGKREGKKEGKRESKNEIAKAMIKENIPIEIITKITKLTKQQINNLK